MNWISFLSKIAALAEEFAPIIESLEPPEAAKVTAAVGAAVGTIVTTLAGKTTTPPTT